LDLDGFIHGNVPCSEVEASNCDDKDYWDQVCLPCEEAYPWDEAPNTPGVDFEWMEGTLEDGETIRTIDPETVTNVLLPTDDGEGELDLYFVPSHGDDPDLAQTTILYNHGNYGGIEHYVSRIRMLHEGGYNVLAWDYRGYGKSLPASAPSPQQFIDDAGQVWAAAPDHVPDPDRIISYGYSLGGIPAVEMAVVGDPCALFLEAAFTSMSLIAQSNSGIRMKGGFLSQGLFENDQKLENYENPLLVMVGSEDHSFPVWAEQELVDAAASTAKELWVPEGVNHGISSGGIPEAGLTTYLDKMATFLDDNATGCLTSDDTSD
ncbi:MAG: alpha/beta hydrolase, partial [Myxococcota bacterium]|nr:alpha/beta hydrolase [Myxococcota bacterium]